ncbi:hypothetical protein ALI22I_01930 [Saccharothrix sp. ALI-22-I]|uniref:hypothetical protein n=1 Tax=Saccharothrix sp. ALI-22-I TaxID=1933778 RepID=UPI00097C05BF|nr:hypothetical protein [Saccharothrix sp. ALI-22-I]ONI92809.1 hypothetical protein ALI22I_01930 [Saccharothrix sp. ALI-22-I]
MIRYLWAVPAVALLSACAGGGASPSDSPTPGSRNRQAPQSQPAIPDKDREAAAALGTYRTIDACGLHDIEAAEKVTGDLGDSILATSDGLNHCELHLHSAENRTTWRLKLEVGARLLSPERRELPERTLGAVEVYQRETERNCTLSKPLDDLRTLELLVSPTGAGTPAKKPCQVATEYLTETAALWSDPPERADGRTTPRLSLAEQDPCTAASAVLDTYGEGAELNPVEVFACEAGPKPDPQAPRTSAPRATRVSFVLDSDPARLVAALGNAGELALGGRKAVILQQGNGCSVYVVWDQDTGIVEDRRARTPVTALELVHISTASCESAQAAAEKIVAKLGTPSRPADSGTAEITLGDLD